MISRRALFGCGAGAVTAAVWPRMSEMSEMSGLPAHLGIRVEIFQGAVFYWIPPAAHQWMVVNRHPWVAVQ